MTGSKRIHTVVLDAGPIIKNTPPVSSLLTEAAALVTAPSVISEIRDEQTRARVNTLLLPFLTLRSPRAENIVIITEFARKTGDLAVLSRPDIDILALAYELECERNSGNWRLRSAPGQKRMNGSPPVKKNDQGTESREQTSSAGDTQDPSGLAPVEEFVRTLEGPLEETFELGSEQATAWKSEPEPRCDQPETTVMLETEIARPLAELGLSPQDSENQQSLQLNFDKAISSDESDSEGWITPSNIKRRQFEDGSTSLSRVKEAQTIQVATVTTDFAMQNVLLQMNLNLLSPSLQRVRHLKTSVLRCYACFYVTKDQAKQFCPRCGKPTLTKVTCTTKENGEFKLHLKKNFQYNTRGDRYSIPKPMPGHASGRVNVAGGGKGGGKGGWGHHLILAEDQKEYSRAVAQEKRYRHKDLMDEDYLPSILGGDRARARGRPKVGAGRNVNARKRN